MSKPLSENLREYMLSKAALVSPYGGRTWDSSAQDLMNNLKEQGIKISKKLFHEYKLPDNLSPQELMETILLEYYFVKYFGFISKRKILTEKNLTIKEKMQIFGYVWSSKKSNVAKKFSKYADEIRKLNPELASIKKIDNPMSCIEGAMFGFAPDEIKYFCDSKLRDFDKERNQQETLKKYGIYPSYILAPDTANELIDALKERKGK